MKALIFDFGGTLDTNGVHWSEKFFDAYLKIGIPITKEEFNQAYCSAEPEVENFIFTDSSFKDVLQKQICLQVDYLAEHNKLFPFLKKNLLAQRVADLCYKDVKMELSKSKELLILLKSEYKLGIISNFYGNLEYVLKEFNINEYFDVVIDSGNLGYKKPDKRIFKELISKLNGNTEDIIMVGDSYSRDIVPAKLFGCKTVWLNLKSWEKPNEISSADFIINDLARLKDIISSI